MNQKQLKRVSEILLSLTTKVKCPMCLGHIENSIEFECSHRFCELCVRKLRAIQEPKPSCPVCRHPISKRAPIYKDRFFDALGRFTTQACQLIKEKYAVGVEEICSKNTDLRQVIETSPRDTPASKRNYTNFAGEGERSEQPPKKKLNFDFPDAENKITSWLDYNQKKMDIVTQQQNTQDDEQDDEVDSFEMPSISQVPAQKNRKTKQRVSPSLTAEDNEVSRKTLEKFKNVNEGLDQHGHYNIEEFASETIVKKVELKVIQNMLEDECLANMEQLANNKTKSTPEQNPYLPETTNKKIFISSLTSDGWNRIKDVKKTLKKREPKKLKILLEDQDNRSNKKSPTNISNQKKSSIGQSSKNKDEAGPPRKRTITPEINIQEKEASTPKGNKPKNQFDSLIDLQSYIDRNIANDEITGNKSTPDIIDKENDDEDIYLLPTQLTAQNAVEQYNLHFVPPLDQALTDTDIIALSLRDELKSCISSAAKFNDALGPKLVDCFTNLLSYARNLQPNKVVSKSAQTMTDNSTVAVQKKIANVAVQTDVLEFGEKGTQTAEQALLDKVKKTPVIGSPLSNKINSNSGTDISYKKSKRKLNFDKKENSSEIFTSKRPNKLQVSNGNSEKKYSSQMINTTMPELSKRNKKSQVLWDNLKENQENNTSSSSVLECSLKSSGNFQISTRETQKSFKRIRMPPPDSDSDDGNPSKRKFLKDDLTVEFIDSEKPAGVDDNDEFNSELIPEKCDPIIFDWIAENAKSSVKSIPAIKTVPDKKPTAKSQKSEYVFTANDVFEENLQKFDEEISLMDQTSAKSVIPKGKTQEHIFTGDDVFEANLAQFDKEILKNEHNSKSYNTELDLVENTPIGNSKPQSNEKNPPIQILSKGGVPQTNTHTCLNNVEDVDLFDKAPSTLNRNLPSEIEKSSDDVAILLEDLHEDDFLTNNMDYAENIESKQDNDKCTFDDDKEDQLLRNIQLTNFQKDAKDEKRLTILQNIRLRSPDKIIIDDVVNISSADDEEIVDATPKKKKRTSLNRPSTEDLLKGLDINEEEIVDDILISPPEGFGVEPPKVETPATQTTVIGQDENYPFSTRRNRLPSVQGLTEFIVTPDEQAHRESQKHETQESLTFVGPMRSPNAATEQGLSFDRSMLPPSRPGLKEKRFGESGASNCRGTQPKYTPLVSTPRSVNKKPIIMTSTPNQKSILNFTSPSQSLLQKAKPCIMWSRIIGKDISIFAQLENKKLVTTSNVFTPSVTHLVVLVDKDGKISSHTAKILHAIAAGIWVVSYEWAEDCLKMKKIVAEDRYEALDSSGEPGPRRARVARGKKSLFKGFKFYLAMPLVTVNQKEMEAIIELTGGEVVKDLGSMLDNEEQFRIIVTESSAMKETQNEQFDTWFDIYQAATVDLLWFSSCIGQFKLISIRPFLVAGDENVVSNLNYPPALLETMPYTLSEAT